VLGGFLYSKIKTTFPQNSRNSPPPFLATGKHTNKTQQPLASQSEISTMSIASNRKAHHDFHILEKYEAGLELQGSEIKSLRAGKANLIGSYIQVQNGQAFLFGCDIAPYEKATIQTHEPKRPRRLLLHKKEILVLQEESRINGKTIVALDLHWKKGRVKLLLATAKGKNTHDKRDALRKKADQKEAAQAAKRFR
jgi:SsrA-binding protein